MNFVTYCHIFLCICIIYIVISMCLDVFGDFPNDPPYFGYNSAGPENPVFVFYCFRDLYGLKLTGDFSRINIFQNMRKLSFETTQTETRRGIGTRWRAHPLDTPLGALASLSLLSRPSKLQDGSLDLKPPYIKVPDASRDRGNA